MMGQEPADARSAAKMVMRPPRIMLRALAGLSLYR